MLVLGLVVLGLWATWTWEWVRLARDRSGLKVRVHVNGTRGKSSVTRLIVAGLRAGPAPEVLGKTTGSAARLLRLDGSEVPVPRPGSANVREQVAVIREAARAGASSLVLECMALQPELQALTELRMIQSTHGVITNIGPDHLDVMGPDVEGVGRALAGTVPQGAKLFTAEGEHLAILERACLDRGSELIVVTGAEVEPEELEGFAHREHPDNVALALRVCADAGVERDRALRAMQAAPADPGAQRLLELSSGDAATTLLTAFAANDPKASADACRWAWERSPQGARRVVVVNCRSDRESRSRELAAGCAAWDAEQIYVTGSGRGAFVRALPADREAALLGSPEQSAEEFLAELARAEAQGPVAVVGLGNWAGLGERLGEHFAARRVADAGEAS